MPKLLSLKFLWFCFAVLVASSIMAPVHDPDIWWHIVAGKWMIAHGELPKVDYWNMYGAGKPWLPYSWSMEVLLSAVDTYFGVYGLLLFKALLALVLSLSMMFLMGVLAEDNFIGALCGSLASFVLISNFALRPQTCGPDLVS